MNTKTCLIITSIGKSDNKALQLFAKECKNEKTDFIVIGDTKSPNDFNIPNCDFYSYEQQLELKFALSKSIPTCKYSRKNIGYLIAIQKGAEIIIETDDDNYPLPEFWNNRIPTVNAHSLTEKGWVNIYKYFTDNNCWPRGFALEYLNNKPVKLTTKTETFCPIQQGLADDNPDVDAIYRLTSEMPIKFKNADNIALGNNTWCPFNSQNTTWFKEAFPLLYLPTYCSFRMTDIWRSFIAQRIAWTNNWNILFHYPTVYQERNEHNLLIDFNDEIPGYLNNGIIGNELSKLNLKPGLNNIYDNLIQCYKAIIKLGLIDKKELRLLSNWIEDCKNLI